MNLKIDIIIWDFDGVLMNSNSIRDLGFQRCLSKFPTDQVEKLLDFHKLNGGLSRYVKFRYFFETIRDEKVSNEIILTYANEFSNIMKEYLQDPNLLIDETINFVKNNHSKYNFHIASGSDEVELKFICDKLNISKYFKSIHGSPTLKIELVRDIIQLNKYSKSRCLLIGDSINDYEAAMENQIFFKAYNGTNQLDSLSNCDFKV